MKIFTLVLMFLLLCSTQVSAIANLNNATIKQAQLYGVSQSNIELQEFLCPWVSYEENAEQINDSVESAYLYTPFLLIATNAREKTLKKEPVLLSDSEKIITDYLDTLSFSVKVLGDEDGFSKEISAILQQDNKQIKAWYWSLPQHDEKCTWIPGNRYMAQCYFYFDEKALDIEKPVILVITTKKGKLYKFYFDLKKIK